MTRREIPQQQKLFHQEIPQMPEGYYSSGPNPNLRRFVEEHAIPYDPETDNYDVQPFDQPIKIQNRRNPINDLHIYWSKKPYSAIRQYIRHFTQPGDIVLDPFCGSGGTALAALMESGVPIAIDLSPAATFITKNYCTPVDVDELQRVLEELKENVKQDMDWLYGTRCDRCDGRATTAYTVYSSVYQCSHCLEKVPLFDCIDVPGETKSGKPKMIRGCPRCHARGITEEIKTTQEKFGVRQVLVSYLCEEGCKPRRDLRTHNDPDPKKRAYFQKYDLGKVAEIETRKIPYWYPDEELAEKIPYRMLHKKDFRPSDATKLSHLFTKRNLWAVSLYLAKSKNSDNFETLRLALSGALFNASKMYKHRKTGGGPHSGTYYLPQVFKEVNVATLFEQKISNIIRAAPYYLELPKHIRLIISTQDATNLETISSNSVDYIFTDPPYGGSIQYGELNYVWEAWLDFDTNWHDQEIIVNETRGKSDGEWAELMRRAMAECYRALKPGRWISLCYHDTSEGTWHFIQDMMTEIGFIPEQSDSILYIDTNQKSFNQIMAEKVTRRDLVINFRKPRHGELNRQLILFGDEDPTTFSQKSRFIITEALTKHPGTSADRLYDELVSRMVRKGEFERHNFDELLHRVAEQVDGRWYLLETADLIDEAESQREIEAADRLEAFMHQYLQKNPANIGVHYSDLFEQFLLTEDKPRRSLLELIPEFFFKTDEGTWRPPMNEEERAQKEALRTSGTLRRIKRFANALLEGVPPYKKDVPANAPSAADWIRQCRRAGLYKQGRALYEKGGFTFDLLGEEAQMEVEEDYQICVRRS